MPGHVRGLPTRVNRNPVGHNRHQVAALPLIPIATTANGLGLDQRALNASVMCFGAFDPPRFEYVTRW
jgi:hypothetical protein